MQIVEFNMTPRDEILGSSDGFIFTKNYAVVIDSKKDENSLTVKDKKLSEYLQQSFINYTKVANPCHTSKQFIEAFHKYMQRQYAELGVLKTLTDNKKQRPYITSAVYNKHYNEVWLFGDCQCLIGGEHFTNRNFIDDVLIQVRRLYLESRILEGDSAESLIVTDENNEVLKPLLCMKRTFLNRHNNTADFYDFFYSAIDGFSYPSENIIVIKVPTKVTEVILATDGYLELRDSLEDTEETLAEELGYNALGVKDFRNATMRSNHSLGYDDRTYLKVSI